MYAREDRLQLLAGTYLRVPSGIIDQRDDASTSEAAHQAVRVLCDRLLALSQRVIVARVKVRFADQGQQLGAGSLG